MGIWKHVPVIKSCGEGRNNFNMPKKRRDNVWKYLVPFRRKSEAPVRGGRNRDKNKEK